ncbi:hypothetical protein IKN40_08755 [bacterium]|nr:hypothetical protein [Clostridia bacterium]MBR2248757.1 hypothetical protein [Bacilli bacterium]MBR4617943.1 hypothetical protein [Bacilli bacterium]MBR6908508.1 hypothetical protein [bacterium]
MDVRKLKEQRFTRIDQTQLTNNYASLNTTKTKPVIKNDEIRLYKIFQKTEVTLNKNEIIEAFNNFRGQCYNHWDKSGCTYSIDIWNLIEYLREKLHNNRIYYDRDAGYTDNEFRSKIKPEELPDDYVCAVQTIFLIEDAKLIDKRTQKEQELIKKSNEIRDNIKIFKHLIRPVIQPICDEFGINISECALYFKNREKFVDFLKLAINEILVKRFEEAGITVSIPTEIGNARSRDFWPTETILVPKDFRVMEGDDVNEENLS